VSGWAIDRPGWKECKGYLREGDTLHVHSIDRLARNLEDLQRTVRELTERGITIKFVKENLTFLGQANPFQVLMFQMVGAFAQFERSMIRERQREGIAKAKEAGKFRGRKPKLNQEQVEKAKSLLAMGVPKAKIADQIGVSRTTIYSVLDGVVDKTGTDV
ncbi:MAG: recombinase family protein, partial [Desulfovibrio sp.]|nr:recombinase family protein [Desulfovibrio sp.]